jgi:hypothetical protein
VRYKGLPKGESLFSPGALTQRSMPALAPLDGNFPLRGSQSGSANVSVGPLKRLVHCSALSGSTAAPDSPRAVSPSRTR